MAEMRTEYKSDDGFYIVRISDSKFFYGDGKTANGFGISANQFLRFNPYMTYVGDQNQTPSDEVVKWIEEHMQDE